VIRLLPWADIRSFAGGTGALTRQLGLDKPIYVQYIYWLIGNDWTKVDLKWGMVIAETPGRGTHPARVIFRHLAGLIGASRLSKVIGERLPNTLLLMVASRDCRFAGGPSCGNLFGLRQYSALDNIPDGGPVL